MAKQVLLGVRALTTQIASHSGILFFIFEGFWVCVSVTSTASLHSAAPEGKPLFLKFFRKIS
ncbi:MAG: hypothetical protein RMK20_00105, partial [Verrucomicrobiales bacterium]|nr:hypothetical protein [Verrucomicrobiales bacterium]